MNELALFAGAGGGILGGKLLGWQTICAVEIDIYAASILVQRQNEDFLEPFPIWDDVSTFDGKPWKGIVDVVSGGFPCQDISAAGKGKGISGERSGLWFEMARIIDEVQSPFLFVENSPLLTLRGLDRVLGDLATMGYNAEWCVLEAETVGAPHERERIWILGYNQSFSNTDEKRSWKKRQNIANGIKGTESNDSGSIRTNISNTMQMGQLEECSQTKTEHAIQGSISGTTLGHPLQGRRSSESIEQNGSLLRKGTKTSTSPSVRTIDRERPDWWTVEPGMGRVVDGVADRMDRIACLGNGQVPRVAKCAWELLYSRMFQTNKK